MTDKLENCRVCGAVTDYLWNGYQLDLKSIRYFECSHCGYVQTEYPYWHERAYSEAINDKRSSRIDSVVNKAERKRIHM